MQRYIEQFPVAGEVVIFDRSWYNRAGVERVLGLTDGQRSATSSTTWRSSSAGDRSGIILIKLWLEIGKEEQERASASASTIRCASGSSARWTSKSFSKWYDYSRARDEMFAASDHKAAPWYVLPSDDKKRARLNGITHILSRVPYKKIKLRTPRIAESARTRGATDDRLDYRQGEVRAHAVLSGSYSTRQTHSLMLLA
jgi:polyphosphate kinase 2 (PPK2 family)